MIRTDKSHDGRAVVIEWELEPRTKPLVGWFSKEEYLFEKAENEEF